MTKRVRNDELRARIASESARILAGDRMQSYDTARQKAARRVGCNDRRRYPDNREIQKALAEYQQLFRGDSQPGALERLRRTALEAMKSFSRFQPRLVGSVLEGTADAGSAVSIRLHAESPEEIALYLIQRRIPWEESERLFRYGGGKEVRRTVYRIQAGEESVELISLHSNDLRAPPLNQITGHPDKGATLKQLEAMLRAPD